MKSLALTLLSMSLLVASCDESRNKQRAEVRQTFKEFSEAFFAKDGETAASFISERTFAYYDRILPLALNADDAQLSELPTLDLFSCISLRHRYSADELQNLDGRKIVTDSFTQMTSPAAAPSILDIGEIDLRTDRGEAVASVYLAPGEWHNDIKVTFHREGGSWKLDFTSMFDALAPRIEPNLMDESSSRAEMVLYYLQIHENEQIGRELLSPRK